MAESEPRETGEEASPRMSFDREIVAVFAEAATRAFLRPELRSVTVVLDYVGNLNSADVPFGLWLSPDGPVTDPAAISGSMQQLARMVGLQCERAQALLWEASRQLEEMQVQARTQNAQQETRS